MNDGLIGFTGKLGIKVFDLDVAIVLSLGRYGKVR